jgi:drug/metabolite transporter (DMT)-like permease
LLALSAFQIAAYRSLIAAFTILAIAALRGERLKLRLDRLNLACAITYAGTLILFVMSTKLTKAANAIFLQFSAPIYLLFLEPLALKTAFKRRDLIAVAACLGGMGLFFAGKLEMGDLLGNVLGMASGVCLAIFSLLLKHKSRIHSDEDPVSAIVLGNFVVFLLCLPMILHAPKVDLRQGTMLLYLGVFQIGIAYMLFTVGMRYVSATGAMITSMLEAVFNPVWVFLGIGEKPSNYAMLGALVMLCVIAWYNLRPQHVDVVAG